MDKIYYFQVTKTESSFIYSNILELDTKDEKVQSLIAACDAIGGDLDYLVKIVDDDTDNTLVFLSYEANNIQLFIDGMVFLKNMNKVFENLKDSPEESRPLENENNNSG